MQGRSPLPDYGAYLMIYIVMGVSGCGKSTIGSLLAKRIGADFADADDYHPPENISKMKQGRPLGDDDRRQWLEALSSIITKYVSADRSLVMACSALKQRYRDILVGGHPPASIKFIYLKCGIDIINQRVSSRQNHFMPPSLIQSQFDDLEEPAGDNVVVIDGGMGIDVIVSRLCR